MGGIGGGPPFQPYPAAGILRDTWSAWTMSSRNLSKLAVEELLEEFVAIGIAQDDALLMNEYARFNRLFAKLDDVETELKNRPGDARRELMRLYGHENFHVWLNAAKATLALAPDAARAQLHAIQDSKHFPQAGDAGMALWTLDEGIYKPT